VYEKCSHHLTIREMKMKTTGKYRLILAKMATVKKEKRSVLARSREKTTLVHHWWKCKLPQPLWKIV
jgi:hypothetical protein